MTFISTKTCTLCSTKISPRNKLCKDCYIHYNAYMQEAWFKEIELLQQKQDEIDRKETILTHNLAKDTDNTTTNFTKNVGHPFIINWKIKQDILDIFDEYIENGKRISLRKIAAMLNNVVTHVTVRTVLLKYRKDVFLKKIGNDNKN